MQVEKQLIVAAILARNSSRERSSPKANGVTGEGGIELAPVTPFGYFVTSLRSRLLFPLKNVHKTRRGLTLVELLVTISIMGLVIAISLPMVKPMLESNKTKSGAEIVAGFLAQARDRAIEEGRPVGVTFERILDYGDGETYFPYNGASILMRQVAEPKPLSGFVKDVRVTVEDYVTVPGPDIPLNMMGRIDFYAWQRIGMTNDWDWLPANSEADYWAKLVNTESQTGDQIQFNAQGPKYEMTRVGNEFYIYMDSSNPNNPNRNLSPPVFSAHQPAMFKVFRKPQPGKVAPTMATPVALPEGIVVDLDCSGMGRRIYNQFGVEMANNDTALVVRDEFCANGQSDDKSVTIMFSPTGEVDKVYYSKQDQGAGNLMESVIPTGPIFLNIGTWELAGFWNEDGGWHVSNEYLPDAKRDGVGNIHGTRNYLDMNNYWVTLFPRTGTIRINRVAQPIAQPDRATVISTEDNFENGSRRFASSQHGPEAK